jgi:hypothetical protein
LQLHRQEKFLYICDTLHMWEWDVRVLDIQDGDDAPIYVGGRGAAPPEFCGGPTGYRLMLQRQREGAAMSDPVRLEFGGLWCKQRRQWCVSAYQIRRPFFRNDTGLCTTGQ